MAIPAFSEPTLDDLMRRVMDLTLREGRPIHPSRGDAVEITGVFLELQEPRARLSRTETRGKVFSALGELCWYLAGSDRLDFIAYYIPKYREETTGEAVYGAYGPRLFAWKGVNQVHEVVERLRGKSDSRRAVIQLFDASDLPSGEKEIPCTSTLQFLRREGRLHLLVNMRSNDAFLGLPHDVFCFTMLQEILSRSLGVELGWYRHAVGSLHLYERDREAAQTFLNEGWQTTQMPMPPMPNGDPCASIRRVLDAETHLRLGGQWHDGLTADLDTYWRDLVVLLGVYAGDIQNALRLRDQITFRGYHAFIDGRLDRREERRAPEEE